MRTVFNRVQRALLVVLSVIRYARWRQISAYLLMVAFICLSAVGAALIYVPAGFITAGLACGLVGYLLGAD